MRQALYIQRANGSWEGWIDVEDGRRFYSYATLGELEAFARRNGYRPVVLDC